MMHVINLVAAFDTSFHRTIPDKAALYAIPYELSAKYGIRRYGSLCGCFSDSSLQLEAPLSK